MWGDRVAAAGVQYLLPGRFPFHFHFVARNDALSATPFLVVCEPILVVSPRQRVGRDILGTHVPRMYAGVVLLTPAAKGDSDVAESWFGFEKTAIHP